jgi:glycosyltransferase involved in cell wall biosynthesis
VIDLLNAVNGLKHDLKNFEVLFVGKGDNQNQMQKYIEENNLEKIVKIIGPVDHHNLNNWINSSDCLCLPSYAEGLPNVVLEALQCQTTVVATNVGGIPEIIENSSDYLVKPGDIENLKIKLLQTLDGSLKKSRSSIEIKDYTQIASQISEYIDGYLIH